MRPPGLRDEPDIGADPFGQLGDFARMIGAELEHRRDMPLRIQAQQTQGHTQCVVVVPRGGPNLALDAENAGDHFLHGGFAIATRQRHHRPLECGAPVKGQRHQR